MEKTFRTSAGITLLENFYSSVLRAPPFLHTLRLRKAFPHQRARRVEHAGDDEILGLCFCHDEYSRLVRIGGARHRSRRKIGRHIFAEPCHSLHQALSGAVFPDDAIALGRGREVAAPGHACAAAQIFEEDGLAELHRLDILAAAVTIDDGSGGTISSKVIRF